MIICSNAFLVVHSMDNHVVVGYIFTCSAKWSIEFTFVQIHGFTNAGNVLELVSRLL